jgi:DNA-binding NarL/FixJ family response regulator
MITTSKTTFAEPPTIVIADDHEIYRRGLQLFLEHEGMRVIESVGTGSQAVDATIKHQPNILILDLAMPDLDGLAVLTLVKYLVPETFVIILTGFGDRLFMLRARELGADCYFSKGVDNDYLIEAIRDVGGNNGSSVYTKTIPTPTAHEEMNRLLPKEKHEASSGNCLTDKEVLILSYLSTGITNQEIAKRATITSNTLKTHLGKIYTKLGVSDRSQAVIWALRNGF